MGSVAVAFDKMEYTKQNAEYGKLKMGGRFVASF